MTNLIVLDVVIGLVFVYLLYSMLASILQELLATWFRFRSKLLVRAIYRMLEDEPEDKKENKRDKRFSSLWYLFVSSDQKDKKVRFTDLFYSHPLVKYLAEDKYHNRPSNITKEIFSKVMIDLLRGDKLKAGEDIKPLIEDSINTGTITTSTSDMMKINPETLSFLQSVWIDAQSDVDIFRKSLEQWFEDTMVHCTAWYKRHTQYILLALGLLIAIVFNVDTISIVGKLEKDPKLRETLVQQADAFTKAHPNLYQERVNDLNNNNRNIALVSTRKDSSTVIYSRQDRIMYKNKLDSIARAKNDSLLNRGKMLAHKADSLVNGDIAKMNGQMGMGIGSISFKNGGWGKLFSTIFGWLITALALSLGAPFWFDLLNKLVKLRSSVSTSTTSQAKGKDEDKKTTVERKETDS